MNWDGRDAKVDQLKQQQVDTQERLSKLMRILQQGSLQRQGLGLQIRGGNGKLISLQRNENELRQERTSIAWHKVCSNSLA